MPDVHKELTSQKRGRLPANVKCPIMNLSFVYKATPVSRGRGYSGRNKDIHRPGNTANENLPPNIQKSAILPPSIQILPTQNTQNNIPTSHNVTGRLTRHSQNQTGSNSVAMKNQPITAGDVQGKVPKNDGAGNVADTNYNQHDVYVLNSKEGMPQHGNEYPAPESHHFAGMLSTSDENSQSVLYIDERYTYLIQQVSLLSTQDDGILTNQKLRHIEGILVIACTQTHMLRSALDAIASAAILDAGMTSRVSLMACSVWFGRSKILNQRLYRLFIEALTDKIDGLEVSLDGADQYLVNAASLLTDIYTESKILVPEELSSLARLIVQVLVELLECNTLLALRTLNVQLMQHGRKLYISVPDRLDDISLSARKLLMIRQAPPVACRPWITLLSDQCLYRFEPLPKYLQDFYARHLDESHSQLEHEPKVIVKPNDANAKEGDPRYNRSDRRKEVKHHDDSTNNQDIKHGNNKTDGHSVKSKKNDNRENRRSLKSDSSDRWSTHSNGNHDQDYKYKDDVFDDKNADSFDSSGVSDSNHSDVDYANQHMGDRKPRPILGAGARVIHDLEGNRFDFSEPPPPIVRQESYNNEEPVDIPVFCASVPPPNFVPRKFSSAGQDTTDYWNTPPPPLPVANNTNMRKDNDVPVNSSPHGANSSAISRRLDLNSWRQINNGNSDKLNYEDPDYSSRDVIESSASQMLEYDEHENTDGAGLQWRKNADSRSVNNDENRQALSWGNKNNAPEIGDENWEETQEAFNNKLQIDSGAWQWGKKKSESVDAVYNNDNSQGDSKESAGNGSSKGWGRRDPRSGVKSGSVDCSRTSERRDSNWERKDVTEETESNWRKRGEKDSFESRKSQGNWANNPNTTRKQAEIKTTEWTNKSLDNPTGDKDKRSKDGGSNANISAASETGDPEFSEDKRSRRDSKGSGSGSGNGRPKRDPMEVSRKASYWTHDDRCDKDYNE